MDQSTLPPWLIVVGYIFSTISTFIGVFLSIYLIQKAKLENQKIILETKKLELEVLEKENKLRGKKRGAEKAKSDNKVQSALEKFLLDIQAIENGITNFLMELMRPFKTYQERKSKVSINGQRIVGTLIEFIFLLLFIYTDLNQSVNTLGSFFLISIPPFLTDLTIPLFISSAGTSMVLGLIMSDLMGLTNLTSWSDLREKRTPFLSIALATLIISVVLSALLSLSRLNLIQNTPPFIVLITSVADSLFIIPTLITTSLLFNGIQGIRIVSALPIILLRFPVTIFRKIVSRITYYVSD